MRKVLLIFFAFNFVTSLLAKSIVVTQPVKPIYRPDWTYDKTNLESPKNNTYVWEFGEGKGNTELEATNIAKAIVYQKTLERISGIRINYKEILQTIQNGTNNKVFNQEMMVPMNEVCKYKIYNTEEKCWIVYILYQVALNGKIKVKFEHFTSCNDSTIYKQEMQKYERELKAYNDSIEKVRKDSIAAADKKKAENDLKLRKYNTSIIASSFVPGMAQIKKGSTGKGVGFICGEVVFIGGTIVSECLYRQYKNQINSASGSNLNKFMQATNICQITRNVCIAGIAATYIWNVIDGIVAKDYNKPSFGSTTFQFSPYVSLEDAGMAVNITF